MAKLDPVNLFTEDVGSKRPSSKLFCGIQSKRLFYILLGIILLLSLILVSLIIILAVPKSTSKISPDKVKDTCLTDPTPECKFCVSNGCIAAAAHQSLFIDKNVEPCDNFFRYACGNWLKTRDYKSFEVERTVIGDIVNEIDSEMEVLLDGPVNEINKASWEWKIKVYYQECRDDYGRVSNSGQAMIELINAAANGWFLFDGGDNTALINNKQTLFEQFAYIQASYGTRAIFDVRIKDDKLEFYPHGLSMEYQDYVLDDDVSNNLDFRELMNYVLADASILEPSTPVYVTNPRYFAEVFKLLQQMMNDNSTLGRREIHNYMRWRLVQAYINDLSYHYVHANRIFTEKYYGHPLHMTNDAYCARETIQKFPLAMIRLYTRFNFHHDNTEEVSTLLTYLKASLLNYINENKWMDEQTKQIAREKANQLITSVGYTTIAQDDNELNKYYENLIVNQTSHFQNAYNFVQFRRTILSDAILFPNKLDHWDTFQQRNKLFDYVAVLNRIFVISPAMQVPLVNHIWPPSLNFGSLGVLLAEKVFSVIDINEGNAYLANGTNFNWWTTNTAKSYSESRQCITDYYTNVVQHLIYDVGGTSVTVTLSGEPFSPITLRQIGALRLAHMALNNYVSSTNTLGYSKEHLLPILERNSTLDQQFFLAYAQSQCFKRKELIQLVLTQFGSYDEETALNTALTHMNEFKDAFNCAPDRPMNTKTKCFDT
ncbi:unnamed protein product [Didymodactylos carnosus]|uniref:Uncharacterized protein n=1 Tax=Didymodactylos carnosus TaxID=1234261 RepID=A0A814C9K4_9BILA|nr:unnamed protein product [Didymodactylos carnosus]CAF3714261.1 unnamed protein product [Didymodactylos carnosus]